MLNNSRLEGATTDFSALKSEHGEFDILESIHKTHHGKHSAGLKVEQSLHGLAPRL